MGVAKMVEIKLKFKCLCLIFQLKDYLLCFFKNVIILFLVMTTGCVRNAIF